MSNNKQSSVGLLITILGNYDEELLFLFREQIKQAKAMHKEEELELINFTSKIFELSKSNFNYTLLTNEEILELYNETYVDKNS